MAQRQFVGGTPIRVALTDNTEQVMLAAPTNGDTIYVGHISIGNGQSSLATVDVKDGATTKYTYPTPPNGGGAGDGFGPIFWELTVGSSLRCQQDLNSSGTYVTCLTRIGPPSRDGE